MFNIDLKKIAFITNANLIGYNINIYNICIDTRDKTIKNSLFIAIRGKNIDSHCLYQDALQKGALALLVNFVLPTTKPQLILQYDTKKALFKIAEWLRKNVSKAKFIGITGSTGKTSVKEITANILQRCGQTLYTYQNFNTCIGISLTLTKLIHFSYKYAVIELGANNLNDIVFSSKIVNPDVGLITNLSCSHLMGFKNFSNIVIEKGKIFNFLSQSGIAVLNFDDNYYKIWCNYIKNKQILYFSIYKNIGVAIFASFIRITLYGSYFFLHTPSGKTKVFIKLLGLQNIINSIAAVALAYSVGVSLQDIVCGLESCVPVKGRLYPIFLKKNKVLLDDTYNSNPRSLFFSARFLELFNGYKILVISDMAELGCMSKLLHIKMGFILNKMSINEILSFGKYSYYISKLSVSGKHFDSLYYLIQYLKYILHIHYKVTILIKGSRIFQMETIIDNL